MVRSSVVAPADTTGKAKIWCMDSKYSIGLLREYIVHDCEKTLPWVGESGPVESGQRTPGAMDP